MILRHESIVYFRHCLDMCVCCVVVFIGTLTIQQNHQIVRPCDTGHTFVPVDTAVAVVVVVNVIAVPSMHKLNKQFND